MSVFNDTEKVVSSDEWGSPEFDAYIVRYADLEQTGKFQFLQSQLRKIQDVNNVDCLYSDFSSL